MPGEQFNALLRIDSCWMAVSVDDDGTEGLCAVFMGERYGWMPLLAADEARLPFILEKAEEIAKTRQQLVRIVRLTTREEVGKFDGRQ